jgi:hypothetical protein
MWGDDWVLIDDGPRKPREEFTPAEMQDRIQRETITMKNDAMTSTSLLVSPNNKSGEKVTLEDFVIKKVIDKGSFGKVFLVENQKNGKVYAMKRLNKDVIL